jgi:DivIVA domain-containing protein
MLTPQDIKNKTFTKGFRGYEVEEVDKYLAELRKEYEYLFIDNMELKETIERVSSKLEYYQQMEATMQSTLAVAQETADEVKANSEKKAALLEHETQVKCDQLLADTMAKVEDMYSQAKTKTENMINATEAECNQLKEETKNLVEKMRNTAEMEAAKLKVSTEDTCKRRTNTAEAEAAKTLETARTEANKMMMEANVNYRKIVGDAEERCRKIIFDAESRASLAENAYNNQVKKAMVHRKHMMHLLKTQMELLENFEDHTVE